MAKGVAYPPIPVAACPKVTDVRLLQPSKARSPMLVTPGMVSEVMPEPVKALPISIIDAGRQFVPPSTVSPLSSISRMVEKYVLFCT